jgi:CheY-like chemotaxis protein
MAGRGSSKRTGFIEPITDGKITSECDRSGLPLVDGFEALQSIKESPPLAAIPVIILTASSSKEDETKCWELGCNFFSTKPYKIDQYSALATVVKKFIPAIF